MSNETRKPPEDDEEPMEIVTDIGDEFEHIVTGVAGPDVIERVSEILDRARAKRFSSKLIVLPGQDIEAEEDPEEEPLEAVPVVHGFVGSPHKQGRGKRTEPVLVDEESLNEAKRGRRKDVKVKPLKAPKRQQNPDHSV